MHATDRDVVLFDGLPVDPSATLDAHRAAQLAQHWDDLTSRLEGRFGIVRVRSNPTSVELVNDPLGIMQLYVAETTEATVISNSAGLVARAVGTSDHDPLGLSTLLVFDWVGGDRTLRRDVRVLPAAQHWRWQPAEGWMKTRYWSYARSEAPTRRVDAELVDEVCGAVGDFTAAAAAVTNGLNAPLTGGKDTRLLAAILMTRGVPARYWTKGVPESLDVQIATKLARLHDLPHQLSGRPTEEAGAQPTPVAEDWDSLTGQFIAQNDGLPNLHLVGNIHGQPAHVNRLAVTLSAMCAESARWAVDQAYLDAPGKSLARSRRYIPYWWAKPPRPLVKDEPYRLARAHMEEVVVRAADEGVPLENLSVFVYLDERARRWAANNPRELAQTEDKVLPFLTRPYVEAALSLHPDEHATDHLHRLAISRLVPGLESEPELEPPLA